MSEFSARRRWFRISLRRVFALVTIAAILTAWAVSNYRRVQQRRAFISVAGAVNGHERTMQGYSFKSDRKSVKWLLFGELRVETIWLYAGTYDDAYFARLQALFPEADIRLESDQD